MKHSDVEGQAIPPTPFESGSVCATHDAPAFVVAIASVGGLEDTLAEPKQSFADGQAMLITLVTPLGAVWFVQDAPPFAVVTITPTEFELWPTAKQALVEVHATPDRELMPPGSVWLSQVVPPLVVARTTPSSGAPRSYPTAKQSVTDGQAIPARADTPPGSDWLVHVEPRSVVASTTAMFS
jgi:hypothetical protein